MEKWYCYSRSSLCGYIKVFTTAQFIKAARLHGIRVAAHTLPFHMVQVPSARGGRLLSHGLLDVGTVRRTVSYSYPLPKDHHPRSSDSPTSADPVSFSRLNTECKLIKTTSVLAVPRDCAITRVHVTIRI